MHVEVVQHEHPFRLGVGRDGAPKVSHEVRLGARGADRLGEHHALDNIPVADQRGRAVAERFKLPFGRWAGDHLFVRSGPFQSLPARQLIDRHRVSPLVGDSLRSFEVGLTNLFRLTREDLGILLRGVDPLFTARGPQS